jgi:pimeloyl-ACP methyl ester carboxylesterase
MRPAPGGRCCSARARAGALCAHVAAEHPERVAGLVLFGAFGRMLRTDGYPWGWPPELYERFLASVEQVWLTGGRPQRAQPRPGRQPALPRLVRALHPPGRQPLHGPPAGRDERRDRHPGLLPGIRTPCLVVVRTADVWLPADNSRYLAEHLAGARLQELPGVDHDPWVGDTEPLLSAVQAFLDQVRAAAGQAGLVAQNR